MNHRGQETPMDFQYDNSSGPVDPNSPFRMSGFQRTLAEETPSKNGTPSIFQSSPIKRPVFTTPGAPSTPFWKAPPPPPFQTPALRTPALQTPAFQTPAFQTPRYTGFRSPSKDSDIFSTPGTDSEAPTPDHVAQLLRSNKKASLSNLTLTPSRVTGRGELRRGSKHHDGAISKGWRRRGGTRRMEPASDDDDDSDDGEGNYSSPHKTSHKGQSSADNWLNTHQTLPAVISGYLGLFVHAAWVLLAVYIIFAAFRVVSQDMDHRIQEAADDVLAQIAECQMHYIRNRCAPDFRVPGMEQKCIVWEKCMNQDPSKVGRAKVSMTTIAEILNGFISELHLKTMAFVVFIITVCYLAGNSVTQAPHPPPPPTPYVPATPMASQWTPRHPPTGAYQFPQQQEWASPLAERNRPVPGYRPVTSDGESSDDTKALEW